MDPKFRLEQKQEANIETAANSKNEIFEECIMLHKKGQLRYIKNKEDLNIFVLKYRSQWKHHALRIECTRILNKTSADDPIRQRNIRRPQLRWRDQHSLQEDGIDQARPNSRK